MHKPDPFVVFTLVLVALTVYAALVTLPSPTLKPTRSEAIKEIAEVAPDRAPSVTLGPNTLSIIDGVLSGVFIKLHPQEPPEILRVETFGVSPSESGELIELALHYGFDLWVEPMDPDGGELRVLPKEHLENSGRRIKPTGRGSRVQTPEGDNYIIVLEKISNARWRLYSRYLD